MPCLVHIYDCLRAWCNPSSIAYGCCRGRKRGDLDVHEYYFQLFKQPDAGADPEAQKAALKACEAEVRELIRTTNCNPILVRLAWHDSGTFDQRIKDFPACGGANGAIRFDPEMTMGANNGLPKAKKYLENIQAKYPAVSWADLIQLASATAVEMAGGPKIPMKKCRIARCQARRGWQVRLRSQQCCPASSQRFHEEDGLHRSRNCGFVWGAHHWSRLQRA